MLHEISKEAKILTDVLSKAVVGQAITYDEMSAAIGRDVRQHAYSALCTARRGVLKMGIVFDVDKNVGYVRLNDTGIVDSTDKDRKSIYRKSKRSLKKLAVAKYDNLDADGKRKHVTMSAVMGTLQLFSTKSASKRIEKRVSESTDVLPVGETLKLFGG